MVTLSVPRYWQDTLTLKKEGEKMRKTIVFLMAVCVFAIHGRALAGGTANVDVSATVGETCAFNGGGTVSFTLDPGSGVSVAGVVTQPTFWCTNGTAYTISDDDGVNESAPNGNRMRLGATTSLVPYSFAYSATGVGLGKTSPITMDIASSVAGPDYAGAPSGFYVDTVVLTITP